ncbi:MAG: hypothetical protein ACI9VR_004335, partial [Cognaticolwellia sp.]
MTSTLALVACRRGLVPVTTCNPSEREGQAQAGVTLLAADFEPSSDCRMTEEQTSGPYYLCVDNHRASIAEDRPGLPC